MKKAWIFILIAVLLLAVLFVPVPGGTLQDGGTRVYNALTYKVVDWHRAQNDRVYADTEIYWFPENFQSVDALWEKKSQSVETSFVATVIELYNGGVMVEPLEGQPERSCSDRISFSTQFLDDIGVSEGSVIRITYNSQIRETYPASIDADSWSICNDLRFMDYPGRFLDPDAVESEDRSVNLRITQIYADCFMAVPVVPMPTQYKLNGQLSEDWCVGDQVLVSYENAKESPDLADRIEADFISVEESTFTPDPYVAYKPVIYLYPEKTQPVSVQLALQGELTCTYPAYQNGWKVTAQPDGTLTDAAGQSYNYLYWEGETLAQWDLTRGFCVAGEDTAAFLEDALEKLGLNRREANEFIVFWLPMMEQNPYNIISFQTDAYTQAAKLEINPAPDTLLRVFMTWKPVQQPVEIPPQTLTAPERDGFTVVEWGGTQVN